MAGVGQGKNPKLFVRTIIYGVKKMEEIPLGIKERTIKRMTKLKRIHVNMHHIRYNKKHGTNKPVITVKSSGSNTYGHSVEIKGPSKVIYSPNKPLSCGARVWIETRSEINIE